MTTHNLVTLSSTEASRLTPNGVHSGIDITVQNVNDLAYVYIGGPDVTTTSYGYRLAPSAGFSIELSGKDSLYVISDTDGALAAVLNASLEAGN